jgi:hypothetical protein
MYVFHSFQIPVYQRHLLRLVRSNYAVQTENFVANYLCLTIKLDKFSFQHVIDEI